MLRSDYSPVRPAGRRAGQLAAVGLVALAAVSCGGGDDSQGSRPTDTKATSEELSGVVRTPPLDVSGISLPDESPGADGSSFEMRAAAGRLLLVYFGFTSCPDICPTTLADIGGALRDNPDDERVDVAFVTVDPDRDTGERISSYLDHFVHEGHALRTTDAGQLETALKAFRATARKIPEGDSYTFEHTAITYAVDEDGKVLLEWPFGVPSDAIEHDIKALLARIDAAADTDEEESP